MNKKEAIMSNLFYVNEYSLRGQFASIEEFSESMCEHTLPLLKKIQNAEGAVLLKKTDFWQAQICSNCTLEGLKYNKQVRYAAPLALKVLIQKLLYNKPYWDEEKLSDIDVEIESYGFDKEYCDNFEKDNCFFRALLHGDNIVSFWHSAYCENYLSFGVNRNGISRGESLLNLACLEHWPREIPGRHWNVTNKTRVCVRLKEPVNHKAHFHVKCSDYEGSFDLYTGVVLSEKGNANIKERVASEVQRWHSAHLSELLAAWNEFHGREDEHE